MNDDDHGPPEPVTEPGPPKPCIRCGRLVESPVDSFLRVNGRDHQGPICVDCFDLIFVKRDAAAFYEGFPE